jgi:UDP-N-acetylmuramoyl-tripeptide--D-alanyl-D-alanine ligase
MLQLDSYSNLRLVTWLLQSPVRRLLDSFQALALGILIGVQVLSKVSPWPRALSSTGLLVWSVATLAVCSKHRHVSAKKPLVYTSRALRLVIVSMLICAGLIFSVVLTARDSIVISLAYLLIVQLCPLVIVISNIILAPVQNVINLVYVRRASRKIAIFSGRTIGVAGSFGKTSTKYFIDTILSTKYRVLKTPQSYNTLLGVCRVINDELNNTYDCFVVEMGAYRRGDVAAIARLVRPDMGIITSIGPEHFERFKSLDNIMATNFELVESLPPGGAAVFNCESQEGRQLASAATTGKTIRYAVTSLNDIDLWADRISTGTDGTAFELVNRAGDRVATRTKLLGVRNVENIVGAACVAIEAGLSLAEVGEAVPRIECAPHRLQVIQTQGGVTIIDDSYNSNPSGAGEALEVLGRFQSGKRVLVTPGMVELGTLEETENGLLGAHAARVCDFIILVGHKQTLSLVKGIGESGFPSERVRVVDNLTEAQAVLATVVRSGDTVLFENDLPDLYDES